ncbi:MAG: MepB protein [Neisseriaceae bacterium]|nr:MAG: MepB protein [Neisseriaceae bacterium]
MIKPLAETIDFLNSIANIDSETVLQSNTNIDYFAHDFVFNNLLCEFRVAKITPKKFGGFVALWKKSSLNKNLPYDSNDFNLNIIYIEEFENSGVFVFPSDIMRKHGLISSNSVGGKLGFRVHPDWVSLESKIALKAQLWQSKYFINFNNDLAVSIAKLKSIVNQEIN